MTGLFGEGMLPPLTPEERRLIEEHEKTIADVFGTDLSRYQAIEGKQDVLYAARERARRGGLKLAQIAPEEEETEDVGE